jgi:hypothetical protein
MIDAVYSGEDEPLPIDWAAELRRIAREMLDMTVPGSDVSWNANRLLKMANAMSSDHAVSWRDGVGIATECCGKTRKTDSCPDCGALLHDGSVLQGLVIHCRGQSEKYRKIASVHAEHAKRFGGAAFPRQSAKAAMYATKWQSWVDAIRKLMEGC